MISSKASPLELQQEIGRLRRGKGVPSGYGTLKKGIKIFQNRRLENTYQDLLEKKDTMPAGRFFLDELYSPGELQTRDHQVERVLPKLEKYLPSSAIAVVRDVIYMDYLAEQMDHLLTLEINKLTNSYEVILQDDLYIQAFREMGNFDARELQINLVRQVGDSMVKLMRFPFLRPLLKMTRGAAQNANLEDFHGFLERGLDAFSTLQNPKVFFSTIQARELQLLSEIANGKLQRFS